MIAVGANEPAVGRHEVDREQVVDREPVPALQPAHPAAEREARDTCVRDDADRADEPVRLRGVVEVAGHQFDAQVAEALGLGGRADERDHVMAGVAQLAGAAVGGQALQAEDAVVAPGLAAVFGLHVINSVTDFRSLSPDAHPAAFRLETFGLSVYVGALVFFYYLSKKENANR